MLRREKLSDSRILNECINARTRSQEALKKELEKEAHKIWFLDAEI